MKRKKMDREEFMAVVYGLLADDPDNNRSNEIIEAADEYAESMKPKWNPRKDGLPDETMEVILTVKNPAWLSWERTSVVMDWYIQKEGQLTMFSDGQGRFGNHRMDEVIAWMPSPEKYEGEADGQT